MAILATIEVDDKGTPVLDRFSDALSRIGAEAARAQAQINDANSSGTTATRQYSDALTSMVGAARASAAEQQAVLNMAKATASGIMDLAAAINEEVSAIKLGAQMFQVYLSGLGQLASTLQGGIAATREQAAALNDLAKAAQAGNGFTQQQAETLGLLNAKIAQGIPLTLAESQAMQRLAEDYAVANRDVLGLGTAMEMLIGKERETAAAAQLAGQAFLTLATQIKAGQQATLLQKEALAELASTIQTNATFTAAHKAELAGLATALEANGSLTREQVASLNLLNAAYQAGGQTIQFYAGIVSSLAASFQASRVATVEQAVALNALARAAEAGNGFTAEQARLLADLNAKIQQGLPLTQAEAAAMERLAEDYAVANRAALGLGSAMDILVQREQQASAEAAKHGQAFQVLATQLVAGERATLLQRDAFAELASAIQTNQKFTAAQKAELQALSDALQRNGTLTKEQVARFNELNTAYQKSISATHEQAGALDKMSDAAKALLGVLTLLVVNGLHELLDESGRLAARVETLGVVMNVVATNADLSTQEMRVQTEAIKKLGITTQESENAVIQFVQANLKLADASKVARVAQDLAVVSGQNSSQAFQTLTAAIQKQEPMLLRQYGIVTGLDKIYGDYAKSIGKTVKELDGLDKKQAFVNSILEQGEKVAGAYEQAMSTTGKQLTSLARYVEEAKLKLGEGLVPVMGIAVRATTELLKAWLELPTPLQNIVSAAGVATIAVTALLSAMVASRWLGIIDAVTKLGAAFKLFYLEVATGSTYATAAANAFSLVNVWLTAIVAVLGIAVAAWVYYNKTQEIAVDKYLEHGAALEAETRSLEKNYQAVGSSTAAMQKLQKEHDTLAAKSKLTRDEQDRLYVVTAKLDDATKKYYGAVASLTKLAPDAVAGIQSQRTAYVDLAEGINRAYNARKQEGLLALEGARSELRRAEAQNEATKATRDKALADEQAILASIKAGEATGRYTEQVLNNGFAMQATGQKYSTATVTLDALKGKLKEAGERSANASEAFRSTSGAVDRFTVGVKALDEALHPEKLEAQNRALVSVNLDDAKTKYKNLAEMIKVAGKAADYLKTATNPEEFATRLNVVTDAWDIHAKKIADDAKKAKKAMDDLRDSILGTAIVPNAQWTELESLLDKSGLSADEYARRLNNAKGMLDKFGKQSEETQARHKGLAVAMQDVKDMAFDTVIQKWNDKFKETEAAVRLTAEGITENLGKALQQITDQTDEKFFDMQLAQDEKLYTERREIYEKTVVAKMKEVDQRIFAEHKALDDYMRTAQKEIDARQKVVDEERKAVVQRSEDARKELEETLRKVDIKTRAEIAGIRAVRTYESRDNAEAIQHEQEVAQRAKDQLDQDLDNIREAANLEIGIREKAALEVVATHQAAADKMTEATRAGVGAQVKYTGIAITEIKKHYNELRVAGKQIFDGVVEAFSAGIAKMITGAQSFKDVLKGIWQSILNSVSSIVQQMVTEWIKGLLKMDAASQASRAAQQYAGGVGGGGGGTGGWIQAAAGLFKARSATTGAIDWSSASAPGHMPGYGVPTSGPGAAGGTTLAGVASAGMAGYLGAAITDKLLKKWIDGSSVKGIASGAAGGFGAGALAGSVVPGIGTIAGGLVGAGVGAIKGWWDARKMREEMKKNREEIVENMGGLEEFKKKAEEAGFAYDKFLNTKKPSEFGEEVVKLKTALDALDLKNARKDLVDAAGGMDALTKSMQLVGFDSDKLFNTKDVAEYSSEVEKLNKLLAEQQKRLEGLGTAAQGLNVRVKSFAEALDKDIGKVFDSLGEQGDKFFEDFEKSVTDGFGGGIVKWTQLQAEAAAKGGDDKTSADLLSKLPTLLAQQERAQKSFTSLGLIATTTFASILRETGDINAAFAATGDSLDTLSELQHKWGLEGSEALQKLLGLRQIAKVNEDLVAGFSATTAVLQGLGQAGRLDQDTFNALGSDASNMFQQLIDRGVESNDALLLAQPTLQALWEAQKKYGFATDESTQAMLDMAEKQGIVGPQMQSINDKMLSVLVLIAKALGATIPAALDAMAGAAQSEGKEAADGIDVATRAAGNYRDKIETVTARLRDMGRAAKDAGRDAEEGATGAAEGHSPTGMKQLIYRIDQATSRFADFRDTFVDGARTMERTVGYGDKVLQFKPPSLLRAEQGSGTGANVTVNHTTAVNLTVNGTKLSPREEWEALRPVLASQIDKNTDQLAATIAKAVARHQKRSA